MTNIENSLQYLGLEIYKLHLCDLSKTLFGSFNWFGKLFPNICEWKYRSSSKKKHSNPTLFLTPNWVNKLKSKYAQNWKAFGIGMNFLPSCISPTYVNKKESGKQVPRLGGYVYNCPFISPFDSWHFKNSFRHPKLENNQLLQKIQSNTIFCLYWSGL